MPEAAVNENDASVFRESYVGAAGQVLPVEAETIPQVVELAPYGFLRSRILTVNLRHDSAALSGGEYVAHLQE